MSNGFTNEGLRYSPVLKRTDYNSDKEFNNAQAETKKSGIESVAKAIIATSADKNNDSIIVDGNKLKLSDIKNWLENADQNGDGVISKEEVQKTGGDKFGLFNKNDDDRKKFNREVENQSLISGAEGVQSGIKFYKFAKNILNNTVKKEYLLEHLENSESKKVVLQYLYDPNYIDFLVLKGVTKDELSKVLTPQELEKVVEISKKKGLNLV